MFRLLLCLVLLFCLLSSSCLFVTSCRSFLALTLFVPCFVLVVCVCGVSCRPTWTFLADGSGVASCFSDPAHKEMSLLLCSLAWLATPSGFVFRAFAFALVSGVGLLGVQFFAYFRPMNQTGAHPCLRDSHHQPTFYPAAPGPWLQPKGPDLRCLVCSVGRFHGHVFLLLSVADSRVLAFLASF